MTVQTIVSEETRTLVIECPARCAETGCEQHAGLTAADWRKSRRMPKDATVEDALKVLASHEEMWPRSGPYRLVEYVESRTRTMEVIEP